MVDDKIRLQILYGKTGILFDTPLGQHLSDIFELLNCISQDSKIMIIPRSQNLGIMVDYPKILKSL